MRHWQYLAATLTILICVPAFAQEFTYNPPGQLVSGSGTGRVDDKVYVPDMRFPIEVAPAYPNSQVWGVGGSQGPSGGQCDERNYSYPWSDNYCESRQWDMPLCPSGTGHQGQDIRPSTCNDKTHWAVAAEDGQIAMIGSYSVYLVTDSGTQHRYLHMDAASLAVSEGQRVSRGDRLGLVSNEFGGTPTTYHLHYDIVQFSQEAGASVYVPTYMSLVRSYETLINQPAEACALVPPEGGILDDYGPCFFAYGNPQFWREEMSAEANEGRFHWTNGFTSANPSNWARWSLFFTEPGTYRVEFNVVPGFNVSKQVRYSVVHAGGEDEQVVDQSGVTGWHTLGEYTFVADNETPQSVNVYDNTGDTADEQHITADAIRLTRLDGPAGDMGMTDMGGNNANNQNNNNGDVDSGIGMPDGEDQVSTSAGCCATVDRTPKTPSPIWLMLMMVGLIWWRRLASTQSL